MSHGKVRREQKLRRKERRKEERIFMLLNIATVFVQEDRK